MANNVKMVPAICTQCGGTVEVDQNQETAKCPFCGASFIIEKAINNYNVKYATIEHADNVNIDVTGATKEVLGFFGDQLEKGRQARKEQREADRKKDQIITVAFFKLFGGMFVGMLIFALIAFIIMQFTGGSEDETQSQEGWTVEETWSVDETQQEDGFFNDGF